MDKRCKICEEVKDRDSCFYRSSQPSKSGHGKRVVVWDSYCKPCRSNFSHDRRVAIKKQAVEYLGGKCVDCGLIDECVEVYDFHHQHGDKDFQIGKRNLSFERLKPELDKCVVLCANCHRKRHAKR